MRCAFSFAMQSQIKYIKTTKWNLHSNVQQENEIKNPQEALMNLGVKSLKARNEQILK